jgi:sugar O-acyltransferase (sialic acid O-acetyltransferase NeuD family)
MGLNCEQPVPVTRYAMKDIVIVGSGGLAKEIKCLIDDINDRTPEWNLLGFIDNWGRQKGDEIIEGKAVIGTTDDLNAMNKEIYAIIAIGIPGRIKDAAEKIVDPNVKFPNLIHPTAIVRSDVKIGFGNIITFSNLISCNVEIGNFNFFNIKCAVGHDTKIGSYNVFNPNAEISGNVIIGDGNFWGLNSSVLQGKRIGNNNTIGACTFVISAIQDNGSYFGIPAKRNPLPVVNKNIPRGL